MPLYCRYPIFTFADTPSIVGLSTIDVDIASRGWRRGMERIARGIENGGWRAHTNAREAEVSVVFFLEYRIKLLRTL